jgi:hypothetical protein
MPVRSVALPLLSGGAVLLGLAAFTWLRPKARGLVRRRAPEVEPLSHRLEHLPEESALDLASDPPLDEHASAHASDIGALFLGRAVGALSPFNHGAGSRSVPR